MLARQILRVCNRLIEICSPRPTSSIVYSIKLLPTERNARYSAGSEPRIFIFNTHAHPRKTQDADDVRHVARKNIFRFIRKNTKPPGGRRCAVRCGGRCVLPLHGLPSVKPRDSIGSIKAGNRTERRNKVNPVAEGAAPIDTPVSLAK